MGDLHAVAGKADDALDIVRVGVVWEFEYDDVAAIGVAAEDAAVKDIGGEREREAGITVGVFGDEEVVADEEGWLH